jgi:hypothetical protein
MPMDSLERGIDRWGENMRETCARVLAAALMTGAIATVVWMSALAGTPNDTITPLAVPAAPPPASVTIRLETVKPPPKPVHRVPVRNAPRTRGAMAAAAVVASPLAAAHPRRAKRPARHLASTAPKPTAPAPAARAPVETVAVAPTPTAALPSDDNGKGNGNAYGHDKARGKGHEKHEE